MRRGDSSTLPVFGKVNKWEDVPSNDATARITDSKLPDLTLE